MSYIESSETPVAPNLLSIEVAHQDLKEYILETPVRKWEGLAKDILLGRETTVWVKMENFQHTNSFKPRGTMAVLQHLNPEQLSRGVCTVSAGNHAIALSFAAKSMGLSVKVAMPRTASPYAVKRCQEMGAEVLIEENVVLAFERVSQIEREEGKFFVHPFEGKMTTLGTATLGWEFYHQIPDIEAFIIPIGGGGLASGMACVIKQLNPNCKIYGVEPFGANTMYLSFQTGIPERIQRPDTIAASLAPPYTLPYAFGICHQFMDEIVLVEDDEMCRAMVHFFYDFKTIVEPAGATSLAALIGPLRHKVEGKKVGIIACGSNIDTKEYVTYLQRGKISSQ